MERRQPCDGNIFSPCCIGKRKTIQNNVRMNDLLCDKIGKNYGKLIIIKNCVILLKVIKLV